MSKGALVKKRQSLQKKLKGRRKKKVRMSIERGRSDAIHRRGEVLTGKEDALRGVGGERGCL